MAKAHPCPAASTRFCIAAHAAASLRLPVSAQSSRHAGATASGVERQRAGRDVSLCCPWRTEATQDNVAYATRESSPPFASPAFGDPRGRRSGTAA